MAFAFSVAVIVTLEETFFEFVLNIPPSLKLPLNSAVGVIVPAFGSRKYTNILLPEFELGAALNVNVEPSGTV